MCLIIWHQRGISHYYLTEVGGSFLHFLYLQMAYVVYFATVTYGSQHLYLTFLCSVVKVYFHCVSFSNNRGPFTLDMVMFLCLERA